MKRTKKENLYKELIKEELFNKSAFSCATSATKETK